MGAYFVAALCSAVVAVVAGAVWAVEARRLAAEPTKRGLFPDSAVNTYAFWIAITASTLVVLTSVAGLAEKVITSSQRKAEAKELRLRLLRLEAQLGPQKESGL